MDIQKTTIYLPTDLFVILRNRARQQNVSIQDVIRQALTTAMSVEDGSVELVEQYLEKRLAPVTKAIEEVVAERKRLEADRAEFESKKEELDRRPKSVKVKSVKVENGSGETTQKPSAAA